MSYTWKAPRTFNASSHCVLHSLGFPLCKAEVHLFQEYFFFHISPATKSPSSASLLLASHCCLTSSPSNYTAISLLSPRNRKTSLLSQPESLLIPNHPKSSSLRKAAILEWGPALIFYRYFCLILADWRTWQSLEQEMTEIQEHACFKVLFYQLCYPLIFYRVWEWTSHSTISKGNPQKGWRSINDLCPCSVCPHSRRANHNTASKGDEQRTEGIITVTHKVLVPTRK